MVISKKVETSNQIWISFSAVHMGDFLETIGDKVPTFCGIKFTSSNLDECARAQKADNCRFAVFLGNDQVSFFFVLIVVSSFWEKGKIFSKNFQLISAACSMGIDSFIVTTLNIFPEHSLKILESWRNDDYKTANKLQEELSTIVHLISKHGRY